MPFQYLKSNRELFVQDRVIQYIKQQMLKYTRHCPFKRVKIQSCQQVGICCFTLLYRYLGSCPGLPTIPNPAGGRVDTALQQYYLSGLRLQHLGSNMHSQCLQTTAHSLVSGSTVAVRQCREHMVLIYHSIPTRPQAVALR